MSTGTTSEVQVLLLENSPTFLGGAVSVGPLQEGARAPGRADANCAW